MIKDPCRICGKELKSTRKRVRLCVECEVAE